MFGCDDGGQQEGAGDEGEDDQKAHEHEEIFQSREGSKEASSDARNRRNRCFKDGLTGFFNRGSNPVRRFAFLAYAMHDVDGIVHTDAEDNGADHGREDVDVDVPPLHQQRLPQNDNGDGNHRVHAQSWRPEHDHEKQRQHQQREQGRGGLCFMNPLVDVQ